MVFVITGQQNISKTPNYLICVFKHEYSKKIDFKVTQNFSSPFGSALEGSYKIKKHLSLFADASFSNFSLEPKSYSFGVRFKNPRHYSASLGFLFTSDLYFGYKLG